jgi:phosphate transport system substrate-binding protein
MFKRLIFAAAMAHGLPLAAEPVRLTSADGGLVIEGTLLSRDGEFFRVETEFGAVTIDAGYMRCSGAGCPDPADLVAKATVGGPPDMVHRLFPALLEVFADERGLMAHRIFVDDTAVDWELRERETDRLIAVFDASVIETDSMDARLAAGSLTLGLSLAETGGAYRQDVIALDALVPAVAPDNPRAMVTHAQLLALLSGEIESWARFWDTDEPVSLHLPEGWEGAKARLGLGRLADGAETYEDLSALADAVAAEPGALGLVPYSALGNAVPLVISGACGLATPATRDTIRAEDYPATQPLFLQRIGADHPKVVRDFIAFSRSAAAQPVIRAAGFVDQAIGRISFERQGGRIANAVLLAGDDPESVAEVRDMIAALLDGERLTLTFRFRDASSQLDPQSESNVQRLADAIARGEFDGHDIVFVGFSDGVGEKAGNLRLSERRARSVRRAVASRLSDQTIDLDAMAFGELMPMACDDTPWGGQVNRRVEVWIKPSEVSR